MKRLLILFLAVFPSWLVAATSLSQYGITWTFDTNYTTGQYANGDYYVVENSPGDGVTITDISPASTWTVLDTDTVTISSASPAVVTWTAHGLFDNQIVVFSATVSLPLPLVAGTVYYVLAAGKTTNTFRISESFGGAAVNTTTPGVGTQTCDAMRARNGSMINPVAGQVAVQGFDSRLNGASSFRLDKNVARPGNEDLDSGNPLLIPAGSSLVSSISLSTPGVRPQLSDAAVLTVVAEAPAANSFRPPYCGTDKSHNWTVGDLDLSLLRVLDPVTGTPSLATVTGYFERPWIEIDTEANGRYYHPANNQPDYGYDMTQRISMGLLSLQLNYSDEQKESLLIRMTQYGLDVYGAAVSGGIWSANGGQNMGRKMPLVLAGILFNDSNILAYADKAQHFIFQEDRQTFVVDETEEGLTPYMADGRLRSSYAQKVSTVTISNASPAVVTWTDNRLASTQSIVFTTTGTLPSPIQPDTVYFPRVETMAATSLVAGMYAKIITHGTTDFHAWGWPVNASDPFFIATGTPTGTGTVQAIPQNSFSVSATDSGSLINTTTAGSGVHTATFALLDEAEFGEKHSSDALRDGSNWDVEYRNTNYECLMGSALTAHLITGAVTAWNWTPYFDYMDRAKLLSNPTHFTAFVNNMWDAYRVPGSIPDAPTDLSATAQSSSSINLVWVDNSGDESGFYVERGLDGVAFTQIAELGVGVESYGDTGLNSATTYYYRVRAYNSYGNSDYTSTEDATTNAAPTITGGNVVGTQQLLLQ